MSKLCTKIAVIAVSLGLSSSALASDGTINFKGVISAAACTVSSIAGSSTASGTVNFGTVSSTSFGKAGSTTGGTPFSIELKDCAVASSPSITFNGAAVATTGYTSLFSTDIAGLGIRISDADNLSTVYAPGVSSENTGFNSLKTGVTQAVANFKAWLVDYTGSSDYTGTIDTNVTFVIDYANT